jgi:hypothetical protein
MWYLETLSAGDQRFVLRSSKEVDVVVAEAAMAARRATPDTELGPSVETSDVRARLLWQVERLGRAPPPALPRAVETGGLRMGDADCGPHKR